MCCGKLNNLMWPMAVKSVVLLHRVTSETKQSLKRNHSENAALHWHLIQHTSFWCMDCQCTIAISSDGCNWCNNFTICQFSLIDKPFNKKGLSTIFEALIKSTKTFVKQNIKTHQHPLIKVSFNNAWLSTSMGNQGNSSNHLKACGTMCGGP